jgi:cation transport ATPase
MNPYAAPGTSEPTRAEDDIAAAAPPTLARVAGGIVVLAGLVVALTGVQTMTIVRLFWPYQLGPYAQLALGLPALFVGATVFRARAWAVLVAIGLTVLLTLVSTAWLYVSITHGLFSLFALGSPFIAMAALVLSILAVGPCQRATEARARLTAQGMNLGL